MTTPIRPSAAPKGSSQPGRLWLTPPEVARERGISVTKVLGWIRTGELEAVNVAARLQGPPRWRVSRDALARFDLKRSNRAAPPATRRRTRVPRPSEITEFFR